MGKIGAWSALLFTALTCVVAQRIDTGLDGRTQRVQ
jgi:hypothetical protein